MKTSWGCAAILIATAVGLTEGQVIVRPFEGYADSSPLGRIDQLVLDRLMALEIQPANACSDAVFVRRVYLDVIGTLPTADETRQFLMDRNPDKRRELIDELLERDEFADYWAMKWGDVLRIKAEFPINLWPNAAQAYHRWVRTSLKENMPYDKFVWEMLTASGSNFRVPQVNFYRAAQNKDPQTIARAVALTFMGTRAENWPEDRLAGMAAFFAHIGYKQTGEWKEEIIFFDVLKMTSEKPDSESGKAVFPDGTPVRLTPDKDPREVFANWLISPENPWFARNVVNRIWCWLQGRGIIHEPDDIRPDNPPRIPELLTWLEQELVAHNYDLKHIYRLILNSKTYQLSSIPRSDHSDAEAYFAYYPLRRLDAEVLADALCQMTGTTEEYTSAIPEPFTFIPKNIRSIELPDGSITSSFLEMFGRPPRDTGLESERNNRSTAAQRLHMLNSSHVRKKIEQSQKLRRAMEAGRRNPMSAVAELYLTILSRFPTEEEVDVLRNYVESGKANGPEILVDLAWALINSTEFLYRH